MSKQDDFEQGLVNRRRVRGDAWVERSLANATEFNSAFQRLSPRFAWDEIWGSFCDLAMAGGNDPTGLTAALESVRGWVAERV